MTIVDDYREIEQEYEHKFGNVLVLFEVGSFFEVYTASPDSTKIHQVGQLLNCMVTRKNKSIKEVSRANPQLLGFPTASLARHIPVLLDSGFTIVVVGQQGLPPRVTRSVTQVISPGVNLEPTTRECHANVVACLALRQEQAYQTGKVVLTMGFAAIDVSTGQSWAFEGVDSTDTSHAVEEAVRLLKSFDPREILLVAEDAQKWSARLQLGARTVHHSATFSDDVNRVVFQNTFLATLFPDTGMLSPLEHIGLEMKGLASAAFVNTLVFVRDHDEALMQRILPPMILNDERILTLENSAIAQLNVLPAPGVPTTKTDSLYSIVCKCVTPMGRRELGVRLSMPLADPASIEARLAQVDLMLRDNAFERVQESLKGLADVERLQRKCVLRRATTMEFATLIAAYDKCLAAMQLAAAIGMPAPAQTEDALRSFRGCVERSFDLDVMTGDDSADRGTFVRRGLSPDVDSLHDAVQANQSVLLAVQEALNLMLDPRASPPQVRLESNDKEGHFFVTTRKRGDALREKLRRRGPIVVRNATIDAAEWRFTNGVTTCKLTCNLLSEVSDRVTMSVQRLRRVEHEEFIQFLACFDGMQAMVTSLVRFITALDCSASAADSASRYQYCRPEIKTAEKSFLEATDLRHPIIERLQTGESYVANTVSLGGEADRDGMLLYGVNACGKSSLLKAVGLAVVLAQAGMYVPASKFVIAPYTRLMTRILSSDNLFVGQSSFTVEMAELRSILLGADGNALVLGDELAHSTESSSATAIVAAALKSLAKSGCQFLIATHLHLLPSLDTVQALRRVQACHLEVRHDPVRDVLVYERTLKPGPGSSCYGLEVCAAMGLPADFLEEANAIRKAISGGEDLHRTSRYNSRMHVTRCGVCGATGDLETHHIKPQHLARKGRIGAMHVNDISNLVALCRRCHTQLHHDGDIDISGYKMTTAGRKLEVKKRLKADPAERVTASQTASAASDPFSA